MKAVLVVILFIGVGAGAYVFFTHQAVAPVMETEAPAPAGKLNIVEVCNGALAYMTFPDGESADAFIAACVNGEHPEVIERFKQDMGLGDGAAI